MILPTDMDLVPGAACTSVLLLFPSSFSMSEAVVDIGVADLEPVKSDNSSCKVYGFSLWQLEHKKLFTGKGQDQTNESKQRSKNILNVVRPQTKQHGQGGQKEQTRC